MKTTTVFAIGRWMPIHLGHKGFLVKLARSFDRLVIGIGSCYENGTPRNCIPAIEREKLLRKMLKTEGITNAIIIPIEDRETFEEWIADVCRVCERYEVTHFCTGNKKDILDVLESKGITLDVEMINPEEGSDFPYHATDIRNAILAGETERLDSMIPAEIKPMVLEQISREILRASRGEGQAFVPGRQTVDLILAVKNRKDQKNYVLIGKRNMKKIDFPGAWAIPGEAIREFESPIDAAIRCFYNETGLKIVLNDNACEPAMITLQSLDNLPCELHFTGIYASRDERINGTRGGGSQCFAIYVEDDIDRITPYLHPIRDMVELKFVDVDEIHKMTLAYDQKHMILDTFVHLGIPYDNGEMLARFTEDGQSLPESVSRKEAHSIGALHGASHVFIYKRANGKLWFLLQRRSLCKDSFPGCLDMSSGGHVEAGYDFLSTALKEISEELSIAVSAGELQVLFSRFISYETVFHGKPFIDREINVVYALEKDLDPKKLALQAQEVAEMVWLEAEVILSRIDQKDPEICMDPEEFKKVINALT